jgi:hypothetical protein
VLPVVFSDVFVDSAASIRGPITELFGTNGPRLFETAQYAIHAATPRAIATKRNRTARAAPQQSARFDSAPASAASCELVVP